MYRKNKILHFDELPMLLQSFLNYDGTIKNNAVTTMQAYTYDLRLFLKYMAFTKDTENKYQSEDVVDISVLGESFFNSVNEEDILEYLYHLKVDRNVGTETRYRYLVSIKAFFGYLYSQKKVINSNPAENIDAPKQNKRTPVYLTEKQAWLLLDSIDRNDKCFYRDYCMLTIMLNCGLRVSELVGMNVSDIRDDDTFTVVGKGDKQRMLFMNESTKFAIEEYLHARLDSEVPIKDKNALFISPFTGKRVTVRRVQQIVAKYLKIAGLDGMGFSPHKLRHTAATLMYQNGVDVRALKDVLGHSQLSTTQIYTHLDKEQLKQAVDLNPLAHHKR